MRGAARSNEAFDVNGIAGDNRIGGTLDSYSNGSYLIHCACSRITNYVIADLQTGKHACSRSVGVNYRAIEPEKLLLLTTRLVAVAPAATPVDTEVMAAGGLVAVVVDVPGPAKKPNVAVLRTSRGRSRGNVSAGRTTDDIAVLHRVIIRACDYRRGECNTNY